jgi:hypothetical protein
VVERGCAVAAEYDEFSVEQDVVNVLGEAGEFGESVGEVGAVSTADAHVAVADEHERTDSVPFRFVGEAVPRRHASRSLRQHRRQPIRHGRQRSAPLVGGPRVSRAR